MKKVLFFILLPILLLAQDNRYYYYFQPLRTSTSVAALPTTNLIANWDASVSTSFTVTNDGYGDGITKWADQVSGKGLFRADSSSSYYCYKWKDEVGGVSLGRYGQSILRTHTTLITSSNFSIFVVTKIKNGSGASAIVNQNSNTAQVNRANFINWNGTTVNYFFNDGTSRVISTTTTPSVEAKLMYSVISNSSGVHTLWLNHLGSSPLSASSYTPEATQFRLGNSGSNSATPTIVYQVLVYSSALSEADRLNVEAYLDQKWNLGLGLVADNSKYFKTSDGNFFNTSNNEKVIVQ